MGLARWRKPESVSGFSKDFLANSRRWPVDFDGEDKYAASSSVLQSPREEHRMAAAAKPATKSEILKSLSESTGLSKKEVVAVFEALNGLIKKELSKKSLFSIPGLVRLKVIKKPATKAGKRPNPFKPGEMMEVKAKPARKVVKAQPLKALKDSVS
jgi:nucleoid DNA-binding protein